MRNPPSSLSQVLFAAAVTAAAWTATVHAEVAGLGYRDALRLAASGLSVEAETVLAGLPEAGQPEGRLLSAVLLLQRQPRTQGNLERADRELAKLQADAPAELAAAAAYFRGRRDQVYLANPNLDAAAQRYREALEKDPEGFYGMLARLRLAPLEIYAAGLTDAQVRERFQRHSLAARELKDPDLRKNLDLTLADAGQRLGLPADWVLPHLLAAIETGILRPATRASILVRTGGLLEETGKPAEAARIYRRFLEEFIRDNRRNVIQERLAKLEAEGVR
jgi:hypothetical protein